LKFQTAIADDNPLQSVMKKRINFVFQKMEKQAEKNWNSRLADMFTETQNSQMRSTVKRRL
jgi:hypothetical protein